MPFRYPMDEQIADKLCWAAVATSIAHYFDRDSLVTQCFVAKEVLGGNCCGVPIPDECNEVQYLENGLDAVHRHEPPPVPHLLAFSDIRALIDQRMPICVRIEWPNTSGHFVVISGYRFTKDDKENGELVEVSDSWFESSILRYDEFIQNYQDMGGRWSHTYRVKK